MPKGELYGEFNLMTSEWTDGLVPKMVRQCVQAGTEGSDNRKWIIFDGPVDAVWIENMNTVNFVCELQDDVHGWRVFQLYTAPRVVVRCIVCCADWKYEQTPTG